MFKKVLAVVLVLAMTCAFLAACGGGSSDSGGSPPAPASSPPAPASSPPAQQAAPPAVDNSGGYSDDDDVMSEDEYEDLMLEFKQVFENQLSALADLLQYADGGFYSEDELVAWCQDFIMMKDTFESQAHDLASALPYVPEYFMEAHTMITFAVAAVTDSMQGFSDAIDAYFNGDEDAFWDGLLAFGGNIQLAEELWNQAYA